MKILKITTGNVISAADIKKGADVRELLAGQKTDCIQYVRPEFLSRKAVLAVDDSGRLRGLAVNEAASLMYGAQFHGHPIVGDVLVMKVSDEPDYVPFDDDEAKTVMQNLMRRFPFLKTEGQED